MAIDPAQPNTPSSSHGKNARTSAGHSRSQEQRAPRGASWSDVPAWLGRFLVLALIISCPWPYGMADWSAQVWLVPALVGILALATIVAIGKRIEVNNPLVWSIGCLLLLALLQCIPLPTTIWRQLSATPALETRIQALASELSESDGGPAEVAAEAESEPAEMLPHTPADAQSPEVEVNNAVSSPSSGYAHTISIHPLQTRASACVLALALSMLVSCLILFRDKLSITVLLSTLAAVGCCNAALGVYQALAAGDWTLLPDMSFTSFATFISRNSAPQFLACSLGAAGGVLILYRSRQASLVDSRYQLSYPSVNPVAKVKRSVEEFFTSADPFSFASLIAMVVLLAGILTANSRGGVLSCLAALITTFAIFSFGKQTNVTGSLSVLLLVLGCGAFLSMFQLDDVIGQRLDTVSQEAYRLDNARLELWEMALTQPQSWLLGSGLGTFHFAILPAYLAPQFVWFYHAENIYVELLSNLGLPGLVAGLVGGGWLLWRLLNRVPKSSAGKAARLAALFAVLAVGLHELVDFSLILPAIFLPLAALVGSYLGVSSDLPSEKSSSTKRTSSRQNNGGKSRRPSRSQRPEGGSHSKRSSRKDSAVAIPSARKVLCCLIPSVTLIAIAIVNGAEPLSNFAEAERISRQVRQIDSGQLAASEDLEWSYTLLPDDFPEVALQLSRMKQAIAQRRIEDSDAWADDLTERMRASLSRPEFFSTVFINTPSDEQSQLRRFLEESQSDSLELLRRSQMGMQHADGACLFDWRVAWGKLRSDLGLLDREERLETYARLILTCRASPRILQAVGSHALLIGETRAGLEIYRELLPVSAVARSRAINFLDSYLDIEQLIEILPPDDLLRVYMAKSITGSNQSDYHLKILQTIDKDAVDAQAKGLRDWQAIAWAAEQLGDVEWQLQALHAAAVAAPMEHRVSYALARVLFETDHFEEALLEMDRALQSAPTSTAYAKFRDEIQAAMSP
ncbi:O-antigen ligase family protein [Aureliella helgolandensis]|uniref:O-Antigen ligase n=1 Tax=Aureliella helgolandensis TaxID=2527968 RepID=A0A518GC01_9BACT|nr:O-antigen ligase family protein [Aureliella helgolandensis]QDV26119.1 O-Antigen ligase [Aureliella helgolandensis]